MSLKSIAALSCGHDHDADLLTVACALAARRGAHLQIVPGFADPAADLVSYGVALGQMAPDVAERIAASEREAQERLESQAAALAAGAGLADVTVGKRALQPAPALAQAAVLADLVLFSGAGVRSTWQGGLFAETLLTARAPCLLVNGAATALAPAAIAWDGSLQAGRAVRAALPLLRAAPAVFILRNLDDAGTEADAADAGPLQSHLERHGVAHIVTRELHGANVADSLLAACRRDSCELLVAGGYGRPRLFELVLGGTSRALVGAPDAPHILFAH